MNKVVLIGRLTKDPELRKTATGTSVVSFILAVNRRIKTEGQPEADFIRCMAWNKTAEVMCQYLSKGSQIGIEGHIQTGQYQGKDGNMVYTTDVVVEAFDFLESKKNKNNNQNQAAQNSYDDYDYPKETLEIASDDLPF